MQATSQNTQTPATDWEAMAAQAREDHLNTQVRPGVTIRTLENHFRLVADPVDWKARIDATVDFSAQPVTERIQAANLIVEAVEFFTATKVEIHIPTGADRLTKLRFVATGYRAGPAGP